MVFWAFISILNFSVAVTFFCIAACFCSRPVSWDCRCRSKSDVPVQFKPSLVLMNLPNAIIYNKVEEQWWWSIPLFQAIINRRCVVQYSRGLTLDKSNDNIWYRALIKGPWSLLVWFYRVTSTLHLEFIPEKTRFSHWWIQRTKIRQSKKTALWNLMFFRPCIIV